MVHRSQGVLQPAGPAPAQRARDRRRARRRRCSARARASRWDELAGDYDRIRDLIARVVPGFEDFNQRVRAPDGFQLPNPAREGALPHDRRPRAVHGPRRARPALAPGQLR